MVLVDLSFLCEDIRNTRVAFQQPVRASRDAELLFVAYVLFLLPAAAEIMRLKPVGTIDFESGYLS